MIFALGAVAVVGLFFWTREATAAVTTSQAPKFTPSPESGPATPFDPVAAALKWCQNQGLAQARLASSSGSEQPVQPVVRDKTIGTKSGRQVSVQAGKAWVVMIEGRPGHFAELIVKDDGSVYLFRE